MKAKTTPETLVAASRSGEGKGDFFEQLARTMQPDQAARLMYGLRDRLYAEYAHNPWCEDAVRSTEVAADHLHMLAVREAEYDQNARVAA